MGEHWVSDHWMGERRTEVERGGLGKDAEVKGMIEARRAIGLQCWIEVSGLGFGNPSPFMPFYTYERKVLGPVPVSAHPTLGQRLCSIFNFPPSDGFGTLQTSMKVGPLSTGHGHSLYIRASRVRHQMQDSTRRGRSLDIRALRTQCRIKGSTRRERSLDSFTSYAHRQTPALSG